MTVTDHEKQNWARIAHVAETVKKDRSTAERFRNAAQQPSIPLAEYDLLQHVFRAWLVFNEWHAL